MTTVVERPDVVSISPAADTASQPRRLWYFVRRSGPSVTVGVLVSLAVITSVWNLAGYPLRFVDEGVYVAQAWSIPSLGELTNYTYWYDHPPLGWIQISLWSVLTGMLHRFATDTVLAGRTFMVLVRVVAVLLVFVLARRLRFRLLFAFAAGLLYVFSPLAVSFGRYVLLDNIAIMWLLAAMVLALDTNRRLSTAIGSAICLAVAILSKETIVLAAPGLFYLIWQHYRQSPNRVHVWNVFTMVWVLLVAAYPTYAILKGELVPGPGHVSLWEGQIVFQLASRSGSGSILDPNSASRQLVQTVWLGLDIWLPLAGVAAILPALFVRRLRALGIALLVLVAWLFKGGYVPYPYIIAMLPFMALLVAGLADAWWPSWAQVSQHGYRRFVRLGIAALVVAMAIPFAWQAAPAWKNTLTYEFTADETAPQQEAVDWVGRNVPKNSQLVTEGELWLDIRNSGFSDPEVIWDYKLDTDPAVMAKLGGIQHIDYLVITQNTLDGDESQHPSLYQAAKGAVVIVSFGSGPGKILVMQTLHSGT